MRRILDFVKSIVCDASVENVCRKLIGEFAEEVRKVFREELNKFLEFLLDPETGKPSLYVLPQKHVETTLGAHARGLRYFGLCACVCLSVCTTSPAITRNGASNGRYLRPRRKLENILILKGMSPYIRTKNRTFGMSCDRIYAQSRTCAIRPRTCLRSCMLVPLLTSSRRSTPAQQTLQTPDILSGSAVSCSS